jgi:hypothetical protein
MQHDSLTDIYFDSTSHDVESPHCPHSQPLPRDKPSFACTDNDRSLPPIFPQQEEYACQDDWDAFDLLIHAASLLDCPEKSKDIKSLHTITHPSTYAPLAPRLYSTSAIPQSRQKETKVTSDEAQVKLMKRRANGANF